MTLSVVLMAPFGSLCGANRSMLLMAEQLAKSARVSLVPLLDDPPLTDLARERGIETRPVFRRDETLPGRLGNWRRAVKVLREEIRRIEAQVVLSNTARGMRFCWPAARWEGCRLVSHQRETYQKNYFHLGLGRADRIISISDYVKSTLPEKLQARAQTIYNPIEVPSETELGRKATAGWTRAWSESEIKIGVAGLCFPHKGQDLLLKAAPTILAKYPRASFHIWGASPRQSQAEYLEELKTLAQPFQDQVIFEPFRSDVDEFFRQMDIVVQPSRLLEGFGRVSAEAMAQATPIVAAGQGGALEIITPGKTGWFHQPNDDDDLARALLEILNNPSASEKIARAGRQFVIENYDPGVHAEAITRFLEETVEAAVRR